MIKHKTTLITLIYKDESANVGTLNIFVVFKDILNVLRKKLKKIKVNLISLKNMT